MNTIEINRIIKNNPLLNKYYCGIYPSDLLPDNPSKPCCFIVNTDPSHLPGKHWVVIYLSENSVIEYFDSFGRPPIINNIQTFINKYGKKLINNKKQIQNNTSNTCGMFCILFIAFKTSGLNMSDFISLFSVDTNYNELLLRKLYKKIV